MSIDTVREYFRQFGRENDVMEFPVSSATVSLAAQALGVEECRIAKSLSFDVKGDTVIIVVAGDRRIDNQKFKAQFATKAKMLPFEETEVRTGHLAGGVCSFAVKEGVKCYLDMSLREYETVYPACGSSNSAIKLTPDEMEKYTDGFVSWIDVCKVPEKPEA